MYIRRVKRKCMVRSCKNTDCFSISRTREAGNTVIACKNCLAEAIEAIDTLPEDQKTNVPDAIHTQAPPLFFNADVQEKQAANDKTQETKQTKKKK